MRRTRPKRPSRPRPARRTARPASTGRSRGEDALATQLHLAGFPEPVREHQFLEKRKFRFDFAYPPLNIGIEVEGVCGSNSPGRHQRADGYAKDCEKYNLAALAGWLVIRATQAQVTSGEALDWIQEALKIRGQSLDFHGGEG